MRQILLGLALLFTITSFAQNTGSIVGKLIDKEFNDEPLAFANVLIKGTTTGTTSDFDGLFQFNNLTPGSYILVYSFVGYETQEITVEVILDKVTTVNVPMLASAASLGEVLIKTSTRRESEVALLLDQKKATEIKQSIGAEELSRKGVSDAAGAVAKISGVSKQEGSNNVYVRGLGDRYLNTTMNGLSLPSNDVNKKNIDLNLFSSYIIENVSISKAYSSRFYGDFSAGNIDITSKDYSGNGFFNVFTSSGVNTRAANKSFVRSEGTGYFGYYGRYEHNPFAVILSHGIDPEAASAPINIGYGASAGKSFDFENGSRLSLFATASFENDYEYRSGVQTDFTSVFKKVFPETEEFEYSTTTTAMVTINYRIDDSNKLKFNSLFINSSSDEVGYFGISGKGQNRDAILNTDEGFYQMNIQFDQDLIYVNQLIGEHKSGNIEVDWAIGYNNTFSHQPDRKRISLENYQFSLDNDASTNPTFYNNIPFDNQRYFQNIKDEELNGRVNLAYSVNENTKLNFGYNGRTKERNFDNIRYGYDIIDSDFAVTDVNNFNTIFNLDNLSLNGEDGVYQTYVFNAINPPQVGQTNRPGLLENTYEGKLDIYAGYVNAEFNLDDEKWLIVPGVRLEAFEQRIDYDVINLTPTDTGFRETNNTFVLPSLSIRYAINDDQNLRFSASKTVSVPEFKEMAPFVYEDVTQRIGGNPDLLNDPSFSEIYNIDVKYDWFISQSELISLGAFGKQINDPINLVIANDATGTQRYFRTGDKATIYGIELEVRKQLLEDEEGESVLSAGFNATYMHTEQELRSTTEGLFTSTLDRTDELQGASPLIVNTDVSYAPALGKYKPKANLIFSYFSDRIAALGSGQLGNIVEKGVPSLDFTLRNEITENFQINLSAKNILDPSIERIREGTSFGDVTLSKYKRGIDLGIQLKFNF